MTCATLTLKVTHLAVNADAGQAGKWLKAKISFWRIPQVSFTYLQNQKAQRKRILDIKCGLLVSLCVLLQTDLALVNIQRIEREIRVCPRVQCPPYLSDFNQKWKTLTKISRTPQGQWQIITEHILCLGFRTSYVNIHKENQLGAV